MKTKRQRLIRRLEIWSIIAINLLREKKKGYIEDIGRISVDEEGNIKLEGTHVNGLNTKYVPAFDLTGPTLILVGHDTGIVIPENIELKGEVK